MPTRPSSFEPIAKSVSFTRTMVRFHLRDGREISVPTAWFPRLRKGTLRERKNWRLIGDGIGVHWPDVDEDILVDSLLASGKMFWYREAPRRKQGRASDQEFVQRAGRRSALR